MNDHMLDHKTRLEETRTTRRNVLMMLGGTAVAGRLSPPMLFETSAGSSTRAATCCVSALLYTGGRIGTCCYSSIGRAKLTEEAHHGNISNHQRCNPR